MNIYYIKMSTNKIYKTLKTFINDLADCFVEDNHALALYARLLSKIAVNEHTDAVEKNVRIFRTFILENQSNIINRVPEFNGTIEYSQKVFLDMNAIFKLTMDTDTRESIWKHLQYLLSLFNPDANISLSTLAISSTLSSSLDTGSEEDKFLNNIINKVSEHISEGDDPQKGINSVMTSGLIPQLVGDITSKINSGNFDITKMLSSVEKMVGSVDGIDPQAKQMLGMLSGLKQKM